MSAPTKLSTSEAAVLVLRETDNPAVMWGDEGLLHLIANRAGLTVSGRAFRTSAAVLNNLARAPGILVQKQTYVHCGGRKRWVRIPPGARMTPNEFRAIVARIELKNPPFACELQVHNAIADDTAAELHVLIRVSDRETGRPTFITHSFAVPPNLSDDPMHALWAVEWVFDRLGRVFHHELRECFHVAERRFREPHPAYDDRDDIELSRAATPAWVESLCGLEPDQLAAAIADNPSIASTLVRALRYERKHGREGS